ncbi:MAG: MmgE/PrpD family protein [Candidimonas sp.]|nr:MAG: MmgE/PrpD family protein [Candidimonas sp.]TAM19809.1 MAG: MmgE/PrpD family protein [Candidimonas sp.]TAM79026.1 MAG: MmgE/PrpD family protein [Candidimonas sp.]
MTIVADFIHQLEFDQLPDAVIAQTSRCVLDLCGVAAGGVTTQLSEIIRGHAAENFCSSGVSARMLFDGRRVSGPGAALAGGMTIDSLDAHDGHVLTKGHVGVTVFPVLLALADCGRVNTGREFLAGLAMGYEVATRAGIALHRTACDYHTSGAWNALAAAALGARALGLDRCATREALGIAEYHGPRSQMMRCIDHPTMVKDGSGWGAMAGLSAAYLARSGFTGAPALTIEDPGVQDIWADLGSRWLILDQYFKPYPVCRWAQPAVEAALALRRKHNLNVADIRQVSVSTFHQASRLATRFPKTTEQAQYSLPFSVAIALSRGMLGAKEVGVEALADAQALRLSSCMQVLEHEEYNQRFPAQRWAEVAFELQDGTHLYSAARTARGDPETAASDTEIAGKFSDLAVPVLGEVRAEDIRNGVAELAEDNQSLPRLLDLVLTGVPTAA